MLSAQPENNASGIPLIGFLLYISVSYQFAIILVAIRRGLILFNPG